MLLHHIPLLPARQSLHFLPTLLGSLQGALLGPPTEALLFSWGAPFPLLWGIGVLLRAW